MSIERDPVKDGGRGSYARACRDRTHRPFWYVSMRKCNYSAFNGYQMAHSDYSEIECSTDLGGCGARWRSKAAYVDKLPNG